MAKPSSKASMDPTFEKQVRKLKTAAKAEHDAGVVGEQVKWFRPENWAGNPLDLDALSDPFDRTKANQDYTDAVSDAANPGVNGDVVATTTMIDYLGVMERAFRTRHTLRRCRATAHALGRKRGQGDDRGPFVQLGIEYIRSVLKQAKGQ